MSVHVYKFLPDQYFGKREESLQSLAATTASFWRSAGDLQEVYLRIIIHNSHYSLEQYVQRLSLLRAKSGSNVWQMRGLTSLVNSLQRFGKESLYQPYVYLMVFLNERDLSDQIAHSFARQTGMLMLGGPDDGVVAPSVVGRTAFERLNEIFLPPDEYWRFLYITNFEGDHSLFSPVFSMISGAGFEMMMAFDVRSYSNSSLLQRLDFITNQSLADVYRSQNNPLQYQKVKRRSDLLTEARSLLLARQESLHEITGAIAFQGGTLAQLNERQNHIFSSSSGYYQVVHLPGTQGLAASLFSNRHPKEIQYPGVFKRNVFSSNLAGANIVGNGFPRPGGNRGIWYGNSYLNGHPIVYDGFGEQGNDANHTVILGSTGSGKTVWLQTMAYRHLLEDMQVIVLEPRGHFRRLCKVVGDSVYNDMGFEKGYSINIFDRIYDDLENQASLIINALSMLLKRDFDSVETSILQNSIAYLYRNYDFLFLENLANDLRHPRWAENGIDFQSAATRIANLIEVAVLDTSLASIFNRPTSGINLNLNEKRLLVFDFERVSPAYQGLLYYLILANINRFCVKQKNRRNRIIIVDEYYLMSQIPQLAESLALFFKTFRTYGVAVWVAEQDWYTLTGFEGQRNKHGEYLISNAANLIALYHNSLRDAQALSSIIPELNDQLLSYITGTKRSGTGLAKLKEYIVPFHLELSDVEKNMFLGS